MPSGIREQNQIESETQAYKVFMRVAKRIKHLEYGKWNIVPDPQEPLRRFTLEKTFDWAKIKLLLYACQYLKRNYDYSNYDNMYAWRYKIGIQGFFRNSNGELLAKTGILLKPRMAKKLLALVNNTFIPAFYTEVDITRKEFENKIMTNRILSDNITKLKGLITIEKHRYTPDMYVGSMPSDATVTWPGIKTSDIELRKDEVNINLTTTYDKAKKILEMLRG
jgi:hypothetical protein